MNTRALGYAPLVPFAAAATAGIVADRYLDIPTPPFLVVAGAGLVAWVAALRRKDLAALAGLWVFAGGLAGAYHHAWRNDFPADDLGNVAAVEPRLVRVRGALDDEPSVRRHPKNDPLVTRPRPDSTVTTLKVTELEAEGVWSPASGLARLTVEGPLSSLHVGDAVEVTGWLSRPTGPMNPGEWDYAVTPPGRPHPLGTARPALAGRRRPATAGAVGRASERWSQSAGGASAGSPSRLDPAEGNAASALLLGDNAAMSAQEWDRYVRTGVIHVLGHLGPAPRRPWGVLSGSCCGCSACDGGRRPSSWRPSCSATP